MVIPTTILTMPEATLKTTTQIQITHKTTTPTQIARLINNVRTKAMREFLEEFGVTSSKHGIKNEKNFKNGKNGKKLRSFAFLLQIL